MIGKAVEGPAVPRQVGTSGGPILTLLPELGLME